MGYETKLIIGKTYPDLILPSDNGRAYVSVIATIDLSGSHFENTFIDESDKVNETFFHGDATDTKIETDCYDQKLYAIEPKKVLSVMKKAHKKEYYRRYAAAIPMLQSLIKDFENENLKCILYGH